MLVYQKNMFDRYYCIKSFFHLKHFGKNASKTSFLYYYNGAQKHEGFVGFENASSRSMTYVLLTSLRGVIQKCGEKCFLSFVN